MSAPETESVVEPSPRHETLSFPAQFRRGISCRVVKLSLSVNRLDEAGFCVTERLPTMSQNTCHHRGSMR
jgi:hypothetical protein